MIRALVSGASGPGSSPGQGHCTVFLGKTLYSRSPSFNPCLQIGIGERHAVGSPAMDYYSIQGGVEILPVASCC